MARLRSAIQYESAREPARRMVIEEADGTTTLVFPVLRPAWAYFLVASSLAATALAAFTLAYVVRFALARQIVWTWSEWTTLILIQVVNVVVWSASAAHHLIWFRNARNTSRQLVVAEAELVHRWPTWRGLGEKRWPLQDITDARCTRVRSLLPGGVFADLLIRLTTKRFPLRFRLHGDQVALGERFVDRLNEARRAIAA